MYVIKSTPALMLAVAIALMPGMVLQGLQFGPAVWLQVGICLIAALLAELAAAFYRQVGLVKTLADCSWVPTGLLLGLSLAPLTPVYLDLLATIVAINLIKHGAGGMGQNRINPAMGGLMVVALAFPTLLYPAPSAHAPWLAQVDLAQAWQAILRIGPRLHFDAMASATPLANHYQGGFSVHWSVFGYLLGGLALAALRVIRLEIPLMLLASCALTCVALGESWADSLTELLYGGLMLAAFFIATDPVTSPVTFKGRLVYAALIGALIGTVRRFGLYPDGICIAVVLCNLLVVDIDRRMRPAVFGNPPEGR